METEYINNWHRVWSNRKLRESGEGSVLEKLISIDGFDSPLGLMEETHWRNYIDMFAQRSGIINSDSIFEVGCGGGAFLYPFYESGHKVSGIDYSGELILVSQSVMPDRKDFLNVTEATCLRNDPREDVVIATHVINYFPTLAYSFEVLTTMSLQAKNIFTVSALPDAQLSKGSKEVRRGLLTNDEYELKYKGLEILYYEKSWFERLASSNGFIAQFFDHNMPGFAQNPYRYDCVMTTSM